MKLEQGVSLRARVYKDGRPCRWVKAARAYLTGRPNDVSTAL